MLTFLDLYQTLLGFVMFRLYLDIGLIYPPPLDVQLDQGAGGLGAFTLKEVEQSGDSSLQGILASTTPSGKKLKGRDVRSVIKELGEGTQVVVAEVLDEDRDSAVNEDEFVPQFTANTRPAELPTLQSISSMTSTSAKPLFHDLVFFVSRETPRAPFEFLVKSFGGKVGWHDSQGAGSPLKENDKSITHFIIDRPLSNLPVPETEEARQIRLNRKFVQPQWIVDCINAGRLLSEGPYEQGKTLPPHLSPFGEGSSTYVPRAIDVEMEVAEDEDDVSETSDAVSNSLDELLDNPGLLHTAEVAAEVAGVDARTFNGSVDKAARRKNKATEQKNSNADGDMNKMMMTNKQRKLYNKLKYSEIKREREVRSMLLFNSMEVSRIFHRSPIWNLDGERWRSRQSGRRNRKCASDRLDIFECQLFLF